MAPKGTVMCSNIIEKSGTKKSKTFSALKVKLEYTLYDESFYTFNESSGLH